MKVMPLPFISTISTALLTLSLAGAAQAATTAPAQPDRVAPAAIVLSHCEDSATAPCNIDAPAAAKTSDDDASALAPAHPQHKQLQPDPATPVPEPETFVMLMLGLVMLGVVSRRNSASEKFTD